MTMRQIWALVTRFMLVCLFAAAPLGAMACGGGDDNILPPSPYVSLTVAPTTATLTATGGILSIKVIL